MTTDRPKVGNIFKAPPPDRSSGLAGLLDAGPPTSPAGLPTTPETPAAANSADPAEVTAPPPPPRHAATGPRRQPRPAPSNQQPNTATASETRIVPVVLDATVLRDLRTFAVRTEQTQGMVALRALEANADDLAGHWATESETIPSSGGLFGHTRSPRRRTEPGVQTQLRIAAIDALTLDQLVEDWAAPSRSALVNEALRRYVRPTLDNDAAP